MALLGTFTQQPNEVLDYDISADEWLSSDDFISSVVTTADSGVTVQGTVISNSGRAVKLWITGGTSGATYKVQVRMTTEDGRVKESELKFKFREV